MATTFKAFWGFILFLSLHYIHSTSKEHVHIVYLGLSHDHDPLITSKYHVQLLSSVFDSENGAKEAMVYSYKHSFSGFAAKLNSSQANTLSAMDEVISVFRSRILKLHTTRSWDFMGLPLFHQGEETPLQEAYGEDVVVGVIDSGIWPESESFKEDPCMGPIPSWWRGTCAGGENVKPSTCNRKLIGARYYLKGIESQWGPLNTSSNCEHRSIRDCIGHGTHTASIAVGNVVKNASFFGFARGVARGGAPKARLAVYKVCWNVKGNAVCADTDVLAAFEDAIKDGVDVISVSLGSSVPLLPFLYASKEIGSFHAAQMGISVVFAAGNAGPEPSLVGNVSPWSTCVAASSIDRTFPTRLLLGNNVSIVGESLFLKQTKLQIVDGANISTTRSCTRGSLNPSLASGKIVLCFSTEGPVNNDIAQQAVLQANGLGLIFAEPMTRQEAQVDFLPTIYVDMTQGTQIRHYAIPSSSPTVQVNPSKTSIGRSPAPTVAYFSSRGPSTLSPNILKPDITAPGVGILAAWPPYVPPSTSSCDKRSVDWNIQSGTSMACPHISGITALLRSAHPDWSPAAVKSAIMTTAYTKDTTRDNIFGGGTAKTVDPFDVGSGHVNPLKAMDPGLVYDMDTKDYIIFLCSIGYTDRQIQRMVLNPSRIRIRCLKHFQSSVNLNYPSIMVSDLQSTMTIRRTVRNVGQTKSIYFVSVVNPHGVKVVVWPRILIFNWFIDTISYYITLIPLKKSQGRYDFGEIDWFDGCHHVRSPLIVRVNNIGDIDDDTATHLSQQGMDF